MKRLVLFIVFVLLSGNALAAPKSYYCTIAVDQQESDQVPTHLTLRHLDLQKISVAEDNSSLENHSIILRASNKPLEPSNVGEGQSLISESLCSRAVGKYFLIKSELIGYLEFLVSDSLTRIQTCRDGVTYQYTCEDQSHFYREP